MRLHSGFFIQRLNVTNWHLFNIIKYKALVKQAISKPLLTIYMEMLPYPLLIYPPLSVEDKRD